MQQAQGAADDGRSLERAREGYRDVDQERITYRKALGWLETYVTGLDPQDEPLGVERVVATKTAVLAFIKSRWPERERAQQAMDRMGMGIDQPRQDRLTTQPAGLGEIRRLSGEPGNPPH